MLQDILEIILITYNRSKSLECTLNQIFDDKSPIKNLNVTILDNCSTDNTENIVKNFNKKNSNIKYIKNNRNIGGNANIVEAYRLASKKYIWVLCDDDYYDWSSWNLIEDAINEDKYDAIMLNNTDNNLAQIMINSTFVPSQIYKTSLIDCTVLENMYCNIQNFFPHLAIMASVINEDKKIFINTNNSIIKRGKDNDNSKTYIRGLDSGYLSPSRRYMFWFVGFIKSLKLLKNKSDIDFILDNLKYVCRNFFELLSVKLEINRNVYGNSLENIFNIFLGLNLKWRLIFPICLLYSYTLNNYSKLPTSISEWITYIYKHKIINRFNKICKNKKRVVIYGIGMIFEALVSSGADLSPVKYISDTNYSEYLKRFNIDVLRVAEINSINPDCIIVAPKKQFKNIKKQLRESGVKCPIISLIK